MPGPDDQQTQLPAGYSTRLPTGVAAAAPQPGGLPAGYTTRAPGEKPGAQAPPVGPVDVASLATKHGLDPDIIQAQVQQESRGNPKAVSPKGAIGLMQLMPDTAERLGVDPHNPHQNVEGGVREMQRLLNKYKGDYRKALAAYNAGETAVDKHGDVPPFKETQEYVSSIMKAQKPKPVAPPAPTKVEDKSRIKPPGPFTSGVATGLGFDPKKLEATTKFKLGDKLYPVAHPMTQMGAEIVKQATQGLGQWMESVAKDPFHIVDPLESMARIVEFHTGQKWDAFGLHKAGIEETALDEVAKGIKSGDKAQLEHGAGRLVGGLAQIFGGTEAPEVVGKVKTFPSEFVDMASNVSQARNKDVVTASANNVLQHDAKNVIIPTIVQAVKNTQESIGRRVKNIADADVAAAKAAGKTGTFTRIDMATAIQDAVKNTNAGSVAKPGIASVAKALSRYKGDLTWEDLKDLRGVVGEAIGDATGKDKASLGKLLEDYTTKLKARAVQLGKGDAWDEYNDTTRKLNEHKNGIISKLQSADTGLKLYTELAKESNQPELNGMFGLLERHGGVPAGFTKDLVKTRRPIFELAKRADAGDASGGRLGALLRHPTAAGTAMVGTGLGLSLASPVPLTGSFVASLIAAQKAANFMDRYDAVKAMREIRQQTPQSPLRGAPTPFPGGATSSPSGPAPIGATPPPSPVAPTGIPTPGASGPVSPSVGAPAAPVSLEDLMGRIKQAQGKVEPPAQTPASMYQGPERRLSRSEFNPMRQANIDALRKELKKPKLDILERAKLESRLNDILAHPEDVPLKGDLKSMKKAPVKMTKEEALAEEAKRHGKEPAKAEASAKQTPYEEFGVKIDKERLTTPEAVRAAKADAKAQIEELGRAKYKEATKLPVGSERTAALAKLDKDVKAASRSVDKMQTPEVSRKQRDVLRKAVDAGKIGSKDASVLENMSPEEVEHKAASGVTNDEANMMEMIDLGREAERMGGAVAKVYQQIYSKTGGDPRTSLPMLRALMDKVRAAKKPAAD